MPNLDVQILPALNDNYVFLWSDPSTKQTAVIDPSEAHVVESALDSQGLTLDFILNTHHHYDHVGGNVALKKKYQCQVYASRFDATRIPGANQLVESGSTFNIGKTEITVLGSPGHTLGHILYHLPKAKILFSGDTLFSLGCGRLFEGDPNQMWNSLEQLLTLPQDTLLYCAHEYTEANAQFALSLQPNHPRLNKKLKSIQSKRAQGLPSVPSTLEEEFELNPFLKANDPELAKAIGMQGSNAVDVFAKIRHLKDNWRG